jgi:hypothetical protein
MHTDADPVVGNWYQHLDKGQKFEVVAVDEENALVEIQYFDGDMDELGLDVWHGLDIEPIEVPEDWTGPLDDVERDDLGYTETDMQPDDWTASVSEVKPTGEEVVREETEKPENESGEGYPEEEPWKGEG